jgi:tellurite resistance protein TerC
MLRQIRRLVIAVIGGTVVLIGVAMIVFPGPAIIVIPAGLAILATEFVWARRLLQRFKEKAERIVERVRPGSSPPPNDGTGEDPARKR